MCKSLYVFNPENDLALADGSRNYTAPKYAKQIRMDLQMLPLWFAKDDAVILADNNDLNSAFLKNSRLIFPQLAATEIFKEHIIKEIFPWGWSPAISYELEQYELHNLLPEEALMEQYRRVSHRRTSIDILEKLSYDGTLPKECFDLDDINEFISSNGDSIIKAPWSSSGRGVFAVNERNLDDYVPLIGGVIKKQGSIICEKALDKVLDFAMEYTAECGNISFKGLSVFNNNNRFSYDTAVVGGYEILLGKITKFISVHEIEQLQERTIKTLRSIVPTDYNGYLGLDMMVHRINGRYEIMPCIELNMRTTMGLLASVLGDDFIKEGAEGEMSILYHSNIECLQKYLEGIEKPVIKANRLAGGSLLLAPVNGNSRFTAVVTMH